MTNYYDDDGSLYTTCASCQRLYGELRKKEEELYYAVDVLKFVRGEPSASSPAG